MSQNAESASFDLITGIQKLARDNSELKVHLRFRNPIVILSLSHTEIGDFEDEDELKQSLLEKTKTIDEKFSQKLETLEKFKWLQIDFIRFSEWIAETDKPSLGSSWLYEYISRKESKIKEGSPICIHFYGHKGGQTRTSFMAQLGKSCSNDGWKVLLLDADFEAPSCHRVFGKASLPLESTVFSFFQKDLAVKALCVDRPFDAPESGAGLYLLGSKANENDLDTANYFSQLNVLSSNPIELEKIGKKIYEYAKNERFDAVFIDQRTGISNIAFPLLESLPGSGIIFGRLDHLWRDASSTLKLFLRATSRFQSILFSPFKLDPEKFSQLYSVQMGDFYGILADALSSKYNYDVSFGLDKHGFSLDDSEIDMVRDVIPNVHIWMQDDAFMNSLLPDFSSLSSQNRDALSSVRANLSLLEKKKYTPIIVESVKLSSSGAKNDGKYLLTESLKLAISQKNDSLFLIGRKGSGKTTAFDIVRSVERTSIPLIADASERKGNNDISGKPGLTFPAFKDFLDEFKSTDADSKFQEFWRKCFLIGSRSIDGTQENLEKAFSEVKSNDLSWERFKTEMEVCAPKTLLFDSFETFFAQDIRPKMLSALFRILEFLDSECKKQKFWIFLRKDLLSECGENQQQLRDSRSCELVWELKESLNLLVCRLAELKLLSPDSNKETKEIIKYVESESRLYENILSKEVCFTILAPLFPETINARGNPTFSNYFEGYFADSFDEDKTTLFNPRFIYYFVKNLKEIKDSNENSEGNIKFKSDDVVKAYTKSSAEYRTEVAEEVRGLLQDTNEIRRDVGNFLNHFRGEMAPFRRELLSKNLVDKSKFKDSDVNGFLSALENLGILYKHETKVEFSRVTRLVRTSLGMKINKSLV
jgi:hypothetical protein